MGSNGLAKRLGVAWCSGLGAWRFWGELFTRGGKDYELRVSLNSII